MPIRGSEKLLHKVIGLAAEDSGNAPFDAFALPER
jgi:hypothetical protein